MKMTTMRRPTMTRQATYDVDGTIEDNYNEEAYAQDDSENSE